MPKGIFERPAESNIWWVLYYVDGKRRREKSGRKSDAINVYRTRKADALAGRKLPSTRDSRAISFAELIDDALEYVADHKDRRNYESKAKIVRKALGDRPAADLTPQELERWLRTQCKTAATSNRYKAFVSLCFREGIHNSKVTANPARQVRHKREGVGRLRFLIREEYNKLVEVIQIRFPEHLAEFVVSINTGIRLSEQYSLTLNQVHLDRRTIDLTKTKNGSARTVHLNADSIASLESIKRKGQKAGDIVFPREGTKSRFDTRSWFVPCLEDAGIEDYVWHSNRHTFCSWLAMAGATIKEIQELAGHKTITMSARYSHLSPEHRLSVIDRIAAKAPTETQEAKT